MMLDLERLRKIWTLVERGGSAGERAAAKDRACAIAGRHGYVLEDIPVLLAGGNVHKAREVGTDPNVVDVPYQVTVLISATANKFLVDCGADHLRDVSRRVRSDWNANRLAVLPRADDQVETVGVIIRRGGTAVRFCGGPPV